MSLAEELLADLGDEGLIEQEEADGAHDVEMTEPIGSRGVRHVARLWFSDDLKRLMERMAASRNMPRRDECMIS